MNPDNTLYTALKRLLEANAGVSRSRILRDFGAVQKANAELTAALVDAEVAVANFEAGTLTPLTSVLAEVAIERARQDAKWGEQNHPSVLDYDGFATPLRNCQMHSIPSPEDARATCEERFAKGIGSYADIALEEFAEVVGAMNEDDRRAELVQDAAVRVAWIEAIDRRNAATEPTGSEVQA